MGSLDPVSVVAAIRRRTGEIVDALETLDDTGMLAPSELPGWDRLTIACHLRYGAMALAGVTKDALRGEPASYYPGGRAVQRPTTLKPDASDRPQDVVSALRLTSDELDSIWSRLDVGQWTTVASEPVDNPDLGPLRLERLALLRLTEVEVHGTDLGLGLGHWSSLFVELALPFRVGRLDGRTSPAGLVASWLLVADDAGAHLVQAHDGAATTRPADPTTPATATITGSSRDLLALLLGRAPVGPIDHAGDLRIAAAFTSVFPGP